jgi:hypothetical protein
MDIDRDFFKTSNIIFSNGDLDPWTVGGVYRNVSGWDSISLLIKNAAHHLDLRSDDPNDTPEIKDARNIERAWIKKWIREYYEAI